MQMKDNSSNNNNKSIVKSHKTKAQCAAQQQQQQQREYITHELIRLVLIACISFCKTKLSLAACASFSLFIALQLHDVVVVVVVLFDVSAMQ